MSERPPETPPPAEREVTPEEYAAFIAGVELECLWLRECQVLNQAGPRSPLAGSVTLELASWWEPLPTGFRAFHRYEARIQADETPLATITVTFGLDFRSSQPMTDRLFALFREINLPVNTWPYFREFLASMTGRMNWLPVTLPTLKRGVESRGEPPAESPPARPTRRTRRRP